MSSQPGNTRSHILETAVKMASREGLRGLSIGMLAKAVGMSKSGLFAHFNSKDKMQEAVYDRAIEDFIKQVYVPAFKQARGEPRLRALYENWAHYFDNPENLPGIDLLINSAIELAQQDSELRLHVEGGHKRLIADFETAAKMAVDEGHFRSDLDTCQFAWEFYSVLLCYHHFKRMLRDPRARKFLDHSFERLIDDSRCERRKQEVMGKKV